MSAPFVSVLPSGTGPVYSNGLTPRDSEAPRQCLKQFAKYLQSPKKAPATIAVISGMPPIAAMYSRHGGEDVPSQRPRY